MAIQKITADVISSDAITTASISDSAITAAKLAGTLDLTGKTITVATASSGDNDTSIASTAFVQQEIASLVDSAPGTLNTLNELAAALGDDANFSTTVTNSIATKLPLAGGSLTGGLTITAGGDNLKLKRSSFDDILLGIGTGNNQSGLHITNTTDTVTIASIHENAPAGSLVMDSSGNIGIGTSSPGVALDLETAGNTADGTYYSTFTINNTGSSTWSRIRFDRSGVARWGLSLGTDDKFMINNLFTGGTTASPDDNALVIDNNSNVGIGTSSPSYNFHLTGNGDTVAAVTAGASSVAALNLGNDTNKADGGIRYDNSANALIFRASNAEKMRIDSSGQVGIGTNSPDGLLHISSGTSGDAIVIIEADTDNNDEGDNPAIWFKGDGDITKGAIRVSDNELEIISNVSAASGIKFYTGATDNTGTTDPGTSATERMRIDASGNLFLNTTSAMDACFVQFTDHSNGEAFLGLSSKDDNNVGIRFGVGTTRKWINYRDTSNNLIWYDNAAAAERMRIKDNGDVNLFGTIGTNSSTAFASMGGRLMFDNDYSDTQRGPNKILLQNDGAWIAGLGISNGSTDFYTGGNFSFRTGTSLGSEKMRIDASGRVTTPNQPAFHAYGPSAAVSTGNYVVYANTYVNTGSHYSTSNGRFTAPVAGVYLFFWSAIGNNTNDVYRWFLYKNGSVNAGGGNDIHLRQDTGATGSEYATNGSRVQMLSLSANDYVQIYFSADSNTSGYYQSDYVNFGGYLIG